MPTPPRQPRRDLHAALLAALRAHYTALFSLPPTTPLTVPTLSTALSTLHLPPSLSPHATAHALLTRHIRPAPSAAHLPFDALVAFLLRVPALPSGPPLVHAHLAAVLRSHRAIRHPYLAALSAPAAAPKCLPLPRQALLHLLRNYVPYNRAFRSNLEAAIAKLRSPSHIRALQHDLAEETGSLADDDLHQLAQDGIQPAWVAGIPHDSLFRSTLTELESVLQAAGDHIGSETDDTAPGHDFCDTVAHFIASPDTSEAAAVGALSIGTEAVVKHIYPHFISAFENHVPEMHLQHYVFFPLHVSVDDAHASTLLDIAREVICRDPSNTERDLIFGALTVLDEREKLWDALLESALKMRSPNDPSKVASAEEEQRSKSGLTTAALYNKQASNWIRRKPTCLSDFTGRPRVVDLLKPIEGQTVLDVGCGEGYLARQLRQHHDVDAVFGVDVSGSMILAAIEEEKSNPLGGLTYAVGDATRLLDIIRESGPASVPGLIVGADVCNSFDAAVACFVFNYVSEKDMQEIMDNVFQTLRPGGKFVFSVPHPCFPFWDLTGRPKELPFQWDEGDKGYFDRVDSVSEGRIMTRDGRSLNVRCTHKTFESYFRALKSVGFTETPDLVELGVTEELLAMDKDFFGPLEGVPLHAAFCVRKPANVGGIKRSPEIIWPSRVDGNNFSLENIQSNTPRSCAIELFKAANCLVEKGMKPIDVCPADLREVRLSETNEFAASIMRNLTSSSGTGAVLVQGILDHGEARMASEEVQGMAYLLLSKCMGNVSNERGPLWHVKDHGLCTSQDNVLFSVSCNAASFHTDGSRRDFFPDVVGLYCIKPAESGGALSLSNACNLYNSLRASESSAVLGELERESVIRDLIEKGLGGSEQDLRSCETAQDVANTIRDMVMRSDKILPLRLKDNVFPIFSRDAASGATRFRYMRDWIESGHQRAGVQIPEILLQAMDALDRELEHGITLKCRLERGDIMFTNNHIIAHAREAFPSGSQRHMIRVWIEADFSG